MNLKETAKEINEILNKKREELSLSFVEEKHTYFMKDKKGKIRTDFPSVSKVLKKFYLPFDAQAKSLQMCKGDKEAQKILLKEWSDSGDFSTNMGSRVHFLLERALIERYDNFKELREPVFKCDESQIEKGNKMVIAGNQFLNLMHERGAVLLDTESVLGDNELGYVGSPDKFWLMFNKEKTGVGVVCTDWKTNQPKNFKVMPYTDKMYPPFNNYPNNALGHYYLQLPLYGRLLIKMLEGSKYSDIQFLGSVIVLLKEDGTYEEFKVPQYISSTIMQMDLSKYVK